MILHLHKICKKTRGHMPIFLKKIFLGLENKSVLSILSSSKSGIDTYGKFCDFFYFRGQMRKSR